MNVPKLGPNYPVLVTERNGRYTLRVKELALVTRSADLDQAYREIVEKKRQIYQGAVKSDTLGEVPEPSVPKIVIRLLLGHAGHRFRPILRNRVEPAPGTHLSPKANI